MKKTLLAMVAATAAGLFALAEPTAHVYRYTYMDEDGLEIPVIGSMRRISPSGVWGTGGDDMEDTGSFIVNTTSPTEVTLVPDGLLLDIDDRGVAVGSWYEREGTAVTKRAAVYANGQWTLLPMPDQVIGQSYAVAISADFSIIGGHAMCANADPNEPGKYFPIFWRLNEQTGQYELDRIYNDLDLPGTMGFFSYAMTPDGQYLCGLQCLNMGDYVGAIFNRADGTVKIWHEITYDTIPIEYMGTILYYNDVMFVDGVMDGGEAGEFHGVFTYATDRYVFGSRDIVSEADAEGNGVITTVATVFDLQTGEFFDGRRSCTYLCGVDPERNFTSSGIIDLVTPEEGPFNLDVNEYLDYFCELEDAGVDGVYCLDKSSKVWGGSTIVISPLGEFLETPTLVMLDDPVFTGIADVTADRDSNAQIWVEGRTLAVRGASEAAVYTPAGQLLQARTGADAAFTLAPGVYIVVADGAARKVVVR